MIDEKEILEHCRKIYNSSYTENWEDKTSAFVAGVKWYQGQTELEELKSEIRELRDEIWDKDYEIEELQNQLKETSNGNQ